MQYLTAQQALADVPYFAKQFSRPSFSNINLTPSGTPWIFVGGSYPGMRAAFMRELYPETIFASWSASAPVEARVDMGVYFEQVYRGLQHYGWGNCTKNIQGAVKYIDGEMAKGGAQNAAIKNFMFGPGGADNSNEGVADTMSYIFYSFQSYGVEGSLGSLRSFCDWVSSDGEGNTAPAEGWEATKGIQWLAERWATWPEWTDVVNNYTPTNCAGHNGTATADTKCQLDLAFPDPGSVSWTWQYCTTWGFFQSSNFGPNRIGSRYNTLKHQQDICYRQFPTGLASGLLPAVPETHKINRLTGGWRGRPTRTMLNGGEFDPWRTLSILSNEDFAPKNVVVSQDIPECDAKGDKNKIFGYLLPDAEHCFDMRKTFPGSAAPRALFKAALTKWLPCFNPTA